MTHPNDERGSRRRFCAALAVLGASACGGTPSNEISVGGVDGGFGGPGPGDLADETGPGDLAQSGSTDLAESGAKDLAEKSPQDLATTESCSGNLAGGAASAIVEGTPKYFSSKSVYLCRDSGGLYAMTSKCTHQGCKVQPQATQFYCNCHGATFDLNGQNPTSPASSPLKHYALCVDASGNVQIDTTTTVSASTRA